MNYLHFVFDVESIGLHGEGFALGHVIVDDSGLEIHCDMISCPRSVTESKWTGPIDKYWVDQNIPKLTVSHKSASSLRAAFNTYLREAEKLAKTQNKKLMIWSDCGWPVEANFLSAMCNDSPYHEGIYPLHEIATVLLCAGMDPVGIYDRLPNELPKHNPLADARQSARLLIQALNKINTSKKDIIDNINKEIIAADYTKPKVGQKWIKKSIGIYPIEITAIDKDQVCWKTQFSEAANSCLLADWLLWAKDAKCIPSEQKEINKITTKTEELRSKVLRAETFVAMSDGKAPQELIKEAKTAWEEYENHILNKN